MKLQSRLFVCAIALMACAAPLAAQNDTSFTNGEIKYAAGTSTATLRWSAKQHLLSGEVSGQILFNGPLELTPGNFTDASFTVDVTCATFAANAASISGTITSSSVPALIGTQSLLSLLDNGQGNNAPPDRYTWIMSSAADCQSFPPATQDVVDGHVHVRPTRIPF